MLPTGGNVKFRGRKNSPGRLRRPIRRETRHSRPPNAVVELVEMPANLSFRPAGRGFCVFHSLLASPPPPHRLPRHLPNPAGRGLLNFSSLLENPTLFWRLLWPLAFPAGSVFRDFCSLPAETSSFAGVKIPPAGSAVQYARETRHSRPPNAVIEYPQRLEGSVFAIPARPMRSSSLSRRPQICLPVQQGEDFVFSTPCWPARLRHTVFHVTYQIRQGEDFRIFTTCWIGNKPQNAIAEGYLFQQGVLFVISAPFWM